jgi:predicted enzyme related to lactoylglutathione lyase
MERVTGLGGIFFRSQNPQALQQWYADRIGIPVGDEGGVTFTWEDPQHPKREGATALAMVPADTSYFGPGGQQFMVNFRVRDLDAMLAQLRAAGVTVDETVQEYEFGRFAWFVDPDGNRVELWEPPGARDRG